MRALKWLVYSFIVVLGLVVVISLVFTFLPSGALEGKTNTITQADLIRLAKDGMVDTITIDGNRLIVDTYNSKTKSIVQLNQKMDGEGVYQLLEDGGVSDWDLEDIWVQERKTTYTNWSSLLLQSLPLLFAIGVLVSITRRLGKRTTRGNYAANVVERPLSESFPDETFTNYRLNPERLKAFSRRGWSRPIAFLIFIVVMVSAIALKNQSAAYGPLTLESMLPSLIGLAVFTPLLAAAAFLGLRARVRRGQQQWLSYKLAIGNQRVVASETGVSGVSIPFDEIEAIDEELGTGMVIRARDKRRLIFVPESLEGYDDARERLNGLKTVVQGKVISTQERNGWLKNYGRLGAFAVAMLVDQIFIAGLAGALLVSSFVCSGVLAFRARNLRQTVSRNAIILGFVLMMLFYRSWYLYLVFSRG